MNKLFLIGFSTFRLFVHLIFTKNRSYQVLLQTIKTYDFHYLKSTDDADFVFWYVSGVCRKLKLNNSCLLVSLVLFEALPEGGILHFGLDTNQNTGHSWYEWEGTIYSTDRTFSGKLVESVIK